MALLSALKTFYEYFFLISTDESTRKIVQLNKSRVNELIDLPKENLRSIPHLSLFKLVINRGTDDLIIRKAATALKHTARFTVAIDGSEVYVHGNVARSLVLKIKDPQPIITLNKSLMSEFNLRSGRFSPHITIARSIPINEFNKLSGSLSQFNYKGEFVCNKITVLRKVIDKDSKYQLLHELYLN